MNKIGALNIASAAQSAFEAGLGEISWDDAVRDMMAVHGAAGGVLFQMNRKTHEIIEWHSVDLNESDEYIEEMNAINPRMHHSLSQSSPHVITDLDCITEEDMARHEFYRWLIKRCHLQFFIGARLMDEGDKSVFMSVEFEAGHAPPNRNYVDGFKTLSAHCANARRLSGVRENSRPATNIDSFLAQKTSTSLFFLDKKCKYFFANPAGESLLSSGCSVTLADGHVALLHPSAQAKLASYYQAIQLDETKLVTHPFNPIFVPAHNNEPPILLRLIHLPQALKGPGNKWSSICLFVQTSLGDQFEVMNLMIQTFDLTKRETEFALTLQKHSTVAEAAAGIGVAHNTARVHLHRIFKKTGVKTQGELAVLIERFSAWI